MKPAPALAEGFPDLSGMRIAREPHWLRWLSAALIVLVLAAIGRAFAAGQIEWSYVSRFLTAKVILEGIVNTMVMAVLAMALGIFLGVVVAIMRLSPNPVLKTVAAGYTWLFRGTPLILQLLLWFNLALVFPTIGIPGLWSARAVDVMTPFLAALLGLGGASLSHSGQFVVAALFGLTASGWNGVFIAEIARLAPQDRIGETTGAVLTASYAGLLAAPALVSLLDATASLGAAFFALACLALCGTVALIWGGHDRASQ